MVPQNESSRGVDDVEIALRRRTLYLKLSLDEKSQRRSVSEREVGCGVHVSAG